jgi:hypothetical protein
MLFMDSCDIESLNKGDVLLIENKRYELITLEWGAHRVADDEYAKVLEIGLHRENSLSISPAEHLNWFPEKSLLVFQTRDASIKIALDDVTRETKA